MISKRSGIALLIAIAALLEIAVALAPRRPQPESYHHFADQREWLGIHRFGDVASNVPFAVIGLWGLGFVASKGGRRAFANNLERIPYALVFLGLFLTAFGSAYYHLAPDNARLVWDRLPMTIVFMSLVAAMLAERVSLKLGLGLLPILLAVGIASVFQWYHSEQMGAGDLRWYAAVQVYALAVLLVALLLPPRYTRTSDLAIVAAFYVLAKILELSDQAIFSAGHIVSGHTLKHLAAAAAGYWILHMLQHRQALLSPASVASAASLL
jgi:hypothetical protein